jgi:hypothetical protein|tara:strand:+ start:346 stop:474 length:129 start_codon:yes stop_codon:yes gene_type:complete
MVCLSEPAFRRLFQSGVALFSVAMKAAPCRSKTNGLKQREAR